LARKYSVRRVSLWRLLFAAQDLWPNGVSQQSGEQDATLLVYLVRAVNTGGFGPLATRHCEFHELSAAENLLVFSIKGTWGFTVFDVPAKTIATHQVLEPSSLRKQMSVPR